MGGIYGVYVCGCNSGNVFLVTTFRNGMLVCKLWINFMLSGEEEERSFVLGRYTVVGDILWWWP